MLSSSVDIWERGDENLICSQNFKNQNTSLIHNRRKSACPIEKGVVRTKGFGTVNLNHVISGIAAALQPLQVQPYKMLGDSNYFRGGKAIMYVDNKWVSTFTGDLAEMLIIQKPIIKNKYFFGPGGIWNDIRLPINYYFNTGNEVIERELWQFTDAEILGAIDGMRLGNEAMFWSLPRRYMRLSQLFESYYTNRCAGHLHREHASKRKFYFSEFMKNRDEFIEQVESFSHILADEMPGYIVNKSIISTESERLVDQFNSYTSNLLIPLLFHQEIHTKIKIRMNVIYDNTWSEYETLTFLLELAERIDVSYYGSSITVIAGDIGNVIVKDSKSIGELFYNWKTYVHDRGTMILPEILAKLNKMKIEEKSSLDDEWFTDITVILAMSTSLDDQDITDSMIFLKSIKQQNPDMIFVYVVSADRAPMYDKLTSIPESQKDRIIGHLGHYSHNQILEELNDLLFNPVAIKPLKCLNGSRNQINNIEKEDYVRPGTISFYRIHPQYLCQVSKTLVIKILNKNYGTLAACLSRDKIFNGNEQCQQISLNGEISFTMRYPCPSRILYSEHQSWKERCKPIYLRISAKHTLTLCTEKECRSPHDIRFQMIIEGLQCSTGKNMCIPNGNEPTSSISYLLLILSLFISISVFR